jgi:hypothetical protein
MQGYVVLSGVYRRVADRVGGEIMLPVCVCVLPVFGVSFISPSCLVPQ